MLATLVSDTYLTDLDFFTIVSTVKGYFRGEKSGKSSTQKANRSPDVPGCELESGDQLTGAVRRLSQCHYPAKVVISARLMAQQAITKL
jgi:hypothetical protein